MAVDISRNGHHSSVLANVRSITGQSAPTRFHYRFLKWLELTKYISELHVVQLTRGRANAIRHTDATVTNGVNMRTRALSRHTNGIKSSYWFNGTGRNATRKWESEIRGRIQGGRAWVPDPPPHENFLRWP